MTYQPEIIYIEEGAGDYDLTRRVLETFPDVPVCHQPDLPEVMDELQQSSVDVFGAGKNRLLLSRFKGSFLKKCPGISPGMVCCNYYVVNLIKNCVYDCSYCFLQDSTNPSNTFRVGTGELTDSLALDDFLPYSETLIPFFNRQSNAVLELKTKSDQVKNLLKQDDASNVIISWSLNPPEIAEREEKGTPGTLQRLNAARLCADKGYRIGFHFDPVILFPGWEAAYADLIDLMFQNVPAKQIEWVSLGGFRYRPNLKKVIQERHEGTQLFTQEQLPSEDGKFRYLRPLRNQAFETLRRMIKDRFNDVNVYLCMETKEIWEGVTGKMPRSDKKLDQFFDL
jgi:spore photoproduct lyase